MKMSLTRDAVRDVFIHKMVRFGSQAFDGGVKYRKKDMGKPICYRWILHTGG